MTLVKRKVIFLDGKMVKAGDALVDSLAPGVVEGRGVFETMRVHEGAIDDLNEHLGRLSRGLKAFKIRAPYSQKRLSQHLHQTIKDNGLSSARIRLAIWKEKRLLRIAIVCQPFKGYSDQQYKIGFKALVSDVKRAKARFSHIKSMDYGCFRKAFLEAQAKGYDEAILLNNKKEIVEGSRANIFFVWKGVLYTPSVKSGCLNGITRQQVIGCARKEKILCRAVAANISKVFKADEAFFTNSLMKIMPLTSVNGRTIGSGEPGAITRKLLSSYCPAKGKSV
jgi:branched-chain amino acid aminotransferase